MRFNVGDGRATFFLRAILEEFRTKNITFMAGSIAYSAFVSLLPILLLTLVVATFVGGQAFADRVMALTEQYLTPTAQAQLSDALSSASQHVKLSVLGLVVLLWSVLKVFRGLDVAFSSLYDADATEGILDQLKDGVIVLVGIGIAILAMVGAGLLVASLPEFPFVSVVSALVLLVALTVALFPIYYVFPDVDVSVREILPGTILSAIGWTVLQSLFRVYVSYSSTSTLYGAIGGIILLVTWLYIGALVLLVGAATNVVLADRSELARPAPNPEE